MRESISQKPLKNVSGANSTTMDATQIDEKMLRDWMRTKFGHLDPNRSTYALALEQLRTAHANLAYYSTKSEIAHSIADLNCVKGWTQGTKDWCEAAIARLEKLSETPQKP